MTFCIGIRVRDGLVCLADTQIVRGEETSNKAKLSLFEHDGHEAIVMTSGLRSVRDKTLMRLEDTLAAPDVRLRRMHAFATSFGDQLRKVQHEDGPSLAASGLRFNLHGIVGGAFADDRGPVLFQIYPEGNWVDATEESPYFIIGRTSYGKPVLDRLLRFDTPLPQAVALACLAFDSTRGSVVDVGYPVDVVVMRTGARRAQRLRVSAGQLAPALAWWDDTLARALRAFPMDWAGALMTEPARPRAAVAPAARTPPADANAESADAHAESTAVS